jgi:hypothetical protein
MLRRILWRQEESTLCNDLSHGLLRDVSPVLISVASEQRFLAEDTEVKQTELTDRGLGSRHADEPATF